MARIRSIKPETWSDQKLARRLSRDARLLYIALWNFADEQARMVGDPRQVKGMCLSMDDDLGPKEIDALLEELAMAGRVLRYEVDDELFLFLPYLSKHQRLDSGQESRFPAPPDHDPAPPPQNSAPTADKSGEVSGQSGEVRGDSGEVQPRARAYVAGSREHVAGSRVNTLVDPAQADRPGTLPTPAAVQEVWDAYLAARLSAGLAGAPVRLTPKRRDKIRTRLKSFPLQDVVDAAWGWTRDPWPERRNHCDAVQVFKTDEHVEKFRDLWRHGPPHTVGKATQQARNTYLQMQQMGGGDGGVAGVERDRGQAQRKLSGPAG